MNRSILKEAALGLTVTGCFVFTELAADNRAPGMAVAAHDTTDTDQYTNQVRVPGMWDSVPPPGPDSLPIPRDTPLVPVPLPDSIPGH